VDVVIMRGCAIDVTETRTFRGRLDTSATSAAASKLEQRACSWHLGLGEAMKWNALPWFLCAVAAVLPSRPAAAQVTNRLGYTLLEGSYFIDECLICGRPTIEEPLRGKFDLVLLQDTAPYSKYAVQNIDFVAGQGSTLERHITGDGTYVRFEEFAILQDMELAVQIKDSYTNRPAFFTNDSRSVEQPLPLIQVDLKQTNGTLLQTFSMHLLAAPVREIWFSTSRPFTSTNRFSPTNQISAGDLISDRGRVVKRNIDLVGRLGIMPSVPDLGLDALFVKGRGEIFFSLPVDVFSETLGPIQHGDLLSNRGYIVKRNQELLAAFSPASSVDAGLDAVQVMPDGQILFSIRSNVVSKAGLLSRGDILSDRGSIFLTHQELLKNFQPSVTNQDFGLDAFYLFTSGEIWFSVEEGFTDNRLGTISSGDLLSSFGYRVFNNQSLVAAFAPADPSSDYGLDALFVVTDTQPARPPPQIVKLTPSISSMHLEWDGEGAVFQVENTRELTAPWFPCSPIVPDLMFDVLPDLASGVAGFYRLRQW